MTTTVADPDSSTVDYRDPELRLRSLFDAGTLRLIAPRDTSGVLLARGEVEGTPAIAYATDATKMGGAMGVDGCQHIVDAIDTAVRERVPVLGLWHSGGARLAEGVVALDAVGQVFAAMVRASGRVPQISVVLGPAAGGAAYGPALTDIVVMSGTGRIFVTGPEVVRSVTGEQVDMARLGGPEPHGRRSGVVHVTCRDDAEALTESRRLAALLGHQGRLSPEDVPDTAEDGHDLAAKMPAETNRAYDVKPVVKALLDMPGVELHAKWAPNIVTTLGRFAGRTVGVIANNPLRLGGCLDASSAEKAARFVRMCDSLGVPLIVLVDVPGYLPGLGQEWDGVVRRGAKLLHAFAEAVVPRVTLVTRKAYGGAYIAMNSRSLGATAVFAWPSAEVAVMGASAAVNILHRKKLAATPPAEREALRAELIEEQIRVAGGVNRALEIGVVDNVIKPAETRRRIAEALAAAPAGRGAHGNIPL
ncbi:acyl-CoA carboxylase subunit beta [Salinispora arenicola]|uniref:Acetyl-CoA/propionyl-CoA carboxylase carboxyl transferase subunit n=1 Tax=Salinispora arenicola TaxID=168697 RepID=A0A542XP63_SALAC|nr:carboxyl transferase domain-containing protein [Salinispora arenicola]TQL37592.1 acetyl-CoA/propionyl-CoA carboxylase carboxyl transferase subunit [Salinispora arenicola]GIM87918.1 putative propionyl-CoA carboxylase beta chain 6 [Salinispora arenicola]